MFRIRPFRNSDPPALAEIWRVQPDSRGIMQPMSLAVLEHFVWSKPYFDRLGLLVAEKDGQPVGFVHGGFGPSQERDDLSSSTGTVCMLQTLPEYEESSLGADLLQAVEGYLIERGATTLIGGECPPYIPFYHGVRSASEQVGVMAHDAWSRSVFANAGYTVDGEYLILNCHLPRIRPFVDRMQRQLARSFEVHPQMDHEFDNWWDTCTFGPTPRSCFQVRSKADHQPVGSIVWWDLDHGIWDSNRAIVGMSRLEITAEHRRAGLATFLTQSALKQLRGSGVSVVQVQVAAINDAGVEFFHKLGFEEVARGISFGKTVEAS